ncbi:MAG: DUF1801 domain-containing protein [Melioribacteraceae bacterium]|nr:DUF1801 domain-containing protein [Melioribacteraceae bacterium]MCF8395507.1 DUF1801 domain-containing protein [Melioribacteraceae bacterium]MCF8420847.1 DUF1801 domain-containing protein [Melioribacteraceae bacterium]
MADLKTKINDAGVVDFLNKLEDKKKREDSIKIIDMIKKITKAEPRMWNSSTMGFGTHRYEIKSGIEVELFLIGFSPRKHDLSIYIMSYFPKYSSLMNKLGKYKTGNSCLYIKKLEDIDQSVLKQLITESVKYLSNEK